MVAVCIFYLVGLRAFQFKIRTRITEKVNDSICAMVRRNTTSNGSSGVHPMSRITSRKNSGVNSRLNIPATLHLNTIIFFSSSVSFLSSFRSPSYFFLLPIV